MHNVRPRACDVELCQRATPLVLQAAYELDSRPSHLLSASNMAKKLGDATAAAQGYALLLSDESTPTSQQEMASSKLYELVQARICNLKP